MNRIPIAVALIALIVTQLFCTQQPATPTLDPSIGQIEKIKGAVQVGPEAALANVEPRLPIYSNDMVHVFDKGKASLDFGYGLTFTLYNDTVGGGTNVSTVGTSRQAALKLSQGGLKGHNPAGDKTTVALPNNVNVVILGTYYFITYDQVEDKVWVFNFDGTVEYQLPGGETQSLPPRTVVEITHGEVTYLYKEMSFSVDDFDASATRNDSPILGVKEILDGAPKIPVTGETSTPTATQTPTDTPTATPTATATATQTPTVTPTPIPCYLAKFVSDVTIPDGTAFNPSAYFTKTWRLKNLGSCTWDSSYRLVFVEGTSMSETKVFPWTGGTAGYGQSVDLSVDLYAPQTPGKYQGNFMLLAPDGTYFGLGVENKSFWVRIAVNVPNSQPDIPAIVSPQHGSALYCGYPNSLDWTIPSDDSGVVEYEVVLEKWPATCFSWCSAFSTSSVFVSTDSLDVSNYLECNVNYRWSVRARDNDGAWSGWTNWTEFTVYYAIQ